MTYDEFAKQYEAALVELLTHPNASQQESIEAAGRCADLDDANPAFAEHFELHPPEGSILSRK